MNRRELLRGVAATPIAWAWQQYASTHTGFSFSGWVPVGPRPLTGTLAGDLGTGHWYHMVWNGDDWFINGELVPPRNWNDIDMETT